MTDIKHLSNSVKSYRAVSYSSLAEEVSIVDDRGPPTDQKQYNVDDAIEAIGFGFLQIRISIFSALTWMADSMEMMLLAVLSPAVACQWSLSSEEEALITTVVFLGMMTGSLVWGIASDRYGRRNTIWLCTFFIFYFGVVTAFAPRYEWLLTVRFLVGFFIGATPNTVTYYSEFLPANYRSICIVLLEFAWAIGSCFEALLALLVMQNLGWRYLVGFSALPALIVLFIFPFVPKSPRFLISINKIAEAEKVLMSCARQNCRSIPEGTLVVEKTTQCDDEEKTRKRVDNAIDTVIYNNDTSTLVRNEDDKYFQGSTKPSKLNKKSGNILALFSKKYFVTTIYLLYIWFASAFVYYGTVFVSILLFVYDHHCDVTINNNSTNTTSCGLQTQDYIEFLISSAAEFPGIILTLVLSDIIGRKLTLFIEFTLSSVSYVLLFTCLGTSEFIAKTVMLFVIRGCITGAFQAAIVYTPEVYPTHIRASAMALFSSFSRIGAIITPFIAQVLLKNNFIAAIMVYSGCSALAGVFSLLLPVETKRKRLEDIEKEFEKRANHKWSWVVIFIPSFDIFGNRKKKYRE